MAREVKLSQGVWRTVVFAIVAHMSLIRARRARSWRMFVGQDSTAAARDASKPEDSDEAYLVFQGHGTTAQKVHMAM